MNKINLHLRKALKSSLAYGLGLGLGHLIIALLFATVDLSEIGISLPAGFLLAGVGIAIFIEAIGSGIGGAIGGLSLSLPPDMQKSRWGKAWRSGLSMGLVFSTVMFVLALALSLFSFYGLSEVDSSRFALWVAIAGVLFGAFFGLLLGLLMVRNHGVWWVIWASMIGFGVGGFGLGEALRRYLLSIKHANLETGNRLWLVLAFVLFGLAGGAALGYVFSYLSEKTFTPRKSKWWHWVVAGAVVLFLISYLRPVLAAALDVLTPRNANLAFVLDSSSTGTHWPDSTNLSDIAVLNGKPKDPIIAANDAGQMALAWLQAEGDSPNIYWLPGMWHADRIDWQSPVNISSSSEPVNPQIVIDSSGLTHIVWEEADTIKYSRCQGETCTPPIFISETPACAPAIMKHTTPTLAIDDADTLMAAWQTDDGQILYRTWSASTQTPAGVLDCVPIDDQGTATQLQLDAGNSGRFALVYVAGENDEGAIYTNNFTNEAWENPLPTEGNGRWPNILLDETDEMHLAWCSSDDELWYGDKDSSEIISSLSCVSRPELARDSQGNLHIIWFGDLAVDVNGRSHPQALLYESTRSDNVWTEPAIINRTGGHAHPSIAATADHLHLVWSSTASGANDLTYASFIPYSCDNYPLDNISQAAYDVARRPEYRPGDDIIPYCQNQYLQLVFMPNPEAAFSDQPSNPNGGFDVFAELVETAEYEVLFSTMWYEADQNNDSPGFVLASSVAELYEKLKANPEQYPRGMLVRILLGNPPEITIEEFSSQLYYVLDDLREAGVDKLVDADIGWRLEVANFEGAMPHSHTKVMIIDGKTILAAGFNMQYEHYGIDHPSGRGVGRQDLGMLVTGPVAQYSHRMFDDLWDGSDLLTCPDLFPPFGVWQTACRTGVAEADHVPEVLKYYLPGGKSNVFSMYRSEDHDEADRIVENSLASAQKQVDAMHVMFTMDMECDLNLLFDLCDFGEATEYLNGLMQAAENGATIRLILKPQPTDGIESSVAYDVFTQELVRRGLRDQVEIRFFEEPIHYKTTLIDNEFLIVGSQNFHYSAFGQGEGLTEYSLGTDDQQAIEDFQRLFEYQWDQANKR